MKMVQTYTGVRDKRFQTYEGATSMSWEEIKAEARKMRDYLRETQFERLLDLQEIEDKKKHRDEISLCFETERRFVDFILDGRGKACKLYYNLKTKRYDFEPIPKSGRN
jgi:hypothetical protein